MDHVRQITEAARRAGLLVIHAHFVVDPALGGAGRHVPLFADITDNGKVQAGTHGAEPFPPVAPLAGDVVVQRSRMSAFHGTAVDTILRNRGITHLLLVGIHTNHALNTTARNAADLGYTPIVVTDATASTSAKAHRADLEFGFDEYALLRSTAEVLDALTTPPAQIDAAK